PPKIDLDKLRGWKNKVVGKLTGGLAGMAKARKVEVVRGAGAFLDAHHVAVELTDGPGQARTGTRKIVRFEKAIIAAGSQSVWLPVGRSRSGKNIGADKAGVAVTDRGFITADSQLRTNVPHIHAIGDSIGQPMLAHKAVHEAHVAAEAAAGEKSFFDARVIPAVAYTDPEIAWVGLTEDEAKVKGVKVEKGLFPWAASGRAIANGRDEGFI